MGVRRALLRQVARASGRLSAKHSGLASSPWLPGAARRWLAGGVDLCFPPSCAACGAETLDAGFCGPCRRAALGLARRRCPGCGRTVATPDAPCGTCLTEKFRFSGLIAVAAYEKEMRRIILLAKHPRRSAIHAALAKLMAEALRGAGGCDAEVVVGVPLHWRRRYFRGGDHAVELARRVAKEFSLPFQRSVRRIKPTRLMAGLPGPKARRREIRGAFAAADAEPFRRRRVLLVDDVVTSGATCNEASRVLLDAGAASVFVLAAARAEFS